MSIPDSRATRRVAAFPSDKAQSIFWQKKTSPVCAVRMQSAVYGARTLPVRATEETVKADMVVCVVLVWGEGEV